MFFHCFGYLVCIIRSPIVRRRVCFRMVQVRKYSNRVVIDAIFPGKSLALFFDSDEMKEQVLSLASENLDRLFLVDVVVQTIEGKPKAYKVTVLHGFADIGDD